MKARTVVLVLLSFLALACSPDSSDSPGEERCVQPLPTRGTMVEGALAIGEGDAANFTSFEDGQQVVLVHGPQGGFMITPVDQEKLGTDGRCVYLHLAASIEGVDPIGLDVHLTDLVGTNGHLTTEALPFLLSFDPNALVGKSCAVTATWQDDGVIATAQVSVVLVQ